MCSAAAQYRTSYLASGLPKWEQELGGPLHHPHGVLAADASLLLTACQTNSVQKRKKLAEATDCWHMQKLLTAQAGL